MELLTNSFHRKFYVWWWGKEPTENFCDYVWQLLIGLLLVIPCFLGKAIYEKFTDQYDINTHSILFKILIYIVVSVLTYATLILLGFAFGSLAVEIILNPYEVLIAVGITLGVALVLFVILLIIALTTVNKTEAYQIVQTRYVSWKDNYCPKIKWKQKQ